MKARGERVKQQRAVAEISRVEGEAVSCTVSESRAYLAEGIGLCLACPRHWKDKEVEKVHSHKGCM